MKRTIGIIILFFAFFQTMFSQNELIDSIVSNLQEGQLSFEKVFIHTNKSNYSNEDVIWFKAYVAKNNNTPSTDTALLYVSLFSKYGKLIKTKKVYIKDGVGNNQFVLNDGLSNGKYLIQAHTSNMLNFGEDNKFITEITIGEELKEVATTKALYDIQFFPEGGYFLEDTNNVLAIKALLNGKGHSYTGKIVNNKGVEVTSFSNEHLGMAKSQFVYKKNERYKALIDINDTIIKRELPLALKKGVALKKVNSDNDLIKFELLANKNTDLNGYILLFHQNNKVIDYINIDFNGKLKKELAFSKKDFLKGVNTITVLKNNQPVLERKFFVEGEYSSLFSVERLNKIKDSIIYKLNLKEIKSKSNISLSVLASEYSYSSNTNIVSAMHLTPYIKGYVENPSFYFNKSNINRGAYLDLLMLTQGWTQYDITDFVDKLNPKPVYDFEIGFTLKGSLSPVLTNNLGLFTTDDHLIAEHFLNNQPSFLFDNLVAYKGDSVKLAFIDKVVLRKKPKKIKFDSIDFIEDELYYKYEKKYLKEWQEKEKQHIVNEVDYISKQDGVIGLENVALETKKKSQAFLDRKAFDKKHRKEVFDIGAYYHLEIPEKYRTEELTLGDYMFKDKGLILYGSTPYSYVISGFEYDFKGNRFPRVVLISIDGVYARPFGRLGMPLETVLLMNMKYIEDISFQPRISKFSDALAVFTTEDYKKGISNNFTTYVFENGYSKSKKYYTPLYSINSEKIAQEIDWKPTLISNNKGELVFKISENVKDEDLLFSIQGFSNEGKLISGFYTLETTKVE